jgi:hypothetical protein
MTSGVTTGPNPLMALAQSLMQKLQGITQPEPDLNFGATRYTNPLLAKHLAPVDYRLPEESLSQFLHHNTRGTPFSAREGVKMDPSSEDAWRMYLGQPQLHGTIEESPWRPTQSSDPDARYFRFNTLKDSLLGQPPDTRSHDKRGGMRNLIAWANNYGAINVDLAGSRSNSALRNVKLGLGQDDQGHYVSIYDVFDLDVPTERGGRGFGRPFEIYDRIYYDPETFEPK